MGTLLLHVYISMLALHVRAILHEQVQRDGALLRQLQPAPRQVQGLEGKSGPLADTKRTII